MPNLKLTLACWDYDRTRPLIDGRVKPEGIDLDIRILRPREIFRRMLDDREFEVSELSLASYTALKGRGECPFIAVPVALSKIFRHSCIYVRTDAGIRTPQDLKGRRVGTSQWSSTGLVFMRGMLQHDYGVKPDGHALVHGRAQQLRRAAADPVEAAEQHPSRLSLRRANAGKIVRRRRARCAALALHPQQLPRRFEPHCPAVSQLQAGRAGLLPPHRHLADHAYGSGARGHSSRASLGGGAASTRRSATPAISRSMASTTPMHCASRCPGSSIMSRRRGAYSARTFGRMVWSRTGLPSRRSAATSTSRACRRAWWVPTSCSSRTRSHQLDRSQQPPRRRQPARHRQDRP